jgi:hypothetical protein
MKLVFIMKTDCFLCEVQSGAKETVNLTISTEAGCVHCVVQAKLKKVYNQNKISEYDQL